MRTFWLLPPLLLALPALAQPQEERFLGTYALLGSYSTTRHTAVDLAIERGADGTLSVTRTGRYTSQRYRNLPAFTWTSAEAKLEGDELRVLFRIGVDGASLPATGIADALDGASEARGKVSLQEGAKLHARPSTSGQVLAALPQGTELKVLRGVDREGAAGPWAWLEVEAGGKQGFIAADAVGMTSGVNVLRATYRLETDARIAEKVVNETRLNPESWWSWIASAGDRLSSPVPEVEVRRLKLGGSLEVKAGGRYTVVVPTDGTLTLKLSSGATPSTASLTLKDPQGAAVATATGEVKHTIPHKSPVLGTYSIELSAAAAGQTLAATFVQDGGIDPRVRPWSSHTYYPIYEGTGSENQNTMFWSDGPLARFDKALGLTGRASAVWWEKGTDYRTSFGFERGHYTRSNNPSEKTAERDWHADLDGDGVISTADVTSTVHFASFDTDGDGSITRAEALPRFEEGAVQSLWAQYDTNLNGKVEKSEIFEQFVTSYDKDGSGDIDLDEWRAALKAAYANVLADRSRAAIDRFMSQDADGNGKLEPAEVRPPGALDFMDSSDVDGDKVSFFDQDNIRVTTQDGAVHWGNKTEKSAGKLKLFKGFSKDELVVELDEAQVKRVETGLADGDIDDSYSVGWWGHCNAWSMSSIVFRKPDAEFEHNGVTFTVRDQKAILVEYGMGATEDSTFWWQEWGIDIPVARYAAGFHRQLHRWLKVEQKGMMADLDLKNPKNSLNFAVWNYPLLGYQATLVESEGDDPRVLDVSCVLTKGSYSDDDSSSTTSVRYRLQFDEAGNILDSDASKTAWTEKSGDELQFIRYLIHPYRFTGPGDSRNPNVTEERLNTVFGEHLKYNRIEDLEPVPGLPGSPSTSTTPGQ